MGTLDTNRASADSSKRGIDAGRSRPRDDLCKPLSRHPPYCGRRNGCGIRGPAPRNATSSRAQSDACNARSKRRPARTLSTGSDGRCTRGQRIHRRRFRRRCRRCHGNAISRDGTVARRGTRRPTQARRTSRAGRSAPASALCVFGARKNPPSVHHPSRLETCERFSYRTRRRRRPRQSPRFRNCENRRRRSHDRSDHAIARDPALHGSRTI